MWIRKTTFEAMVNDRREQEQQLGRKIDAAQFAAGKALIEQARALGEVHRLEIENARLRSDMDWFKLRLTQVEKERAQLILSSTGVKIPYPDFTPAYNPEDALNNMPDLSSIGGDARDDGESAPAEQMGVDYSLLPGYKK